MAYNQNQAGPFWDFVRSLSGPQYQGEGVDHPAGEEHYSGPPPPSGPAPPPGPPPPGGPHGFPFSHSGVGAGAHGQANFPFVGPWGFGAGAYAGPGHHGPHGPWEGRRGGGRRGRHGGRREGSRSPSPEHEDEARENVEGGPSEGEDRAHGHGRHRRGRSHHGRRGRDAFGGRGGFAGFRGGPGGAPFDLAALLSSLQAHPLGQAIGRFAAQSGMGAQPQTSGETLNDDTDSESSFVPPIDVFSTPTAYVLHVALPGAKKEDVGVNWDADKGELNVAGVVYRSGDEAFLSSPGRRERKVGVFERSVRLPPAPEDKDEVDGEGITAKLEDGVLVVTVPKVEKEWTDVKKVDIL